MSVTRQSIIDQLKEILQNADAKYSARLENCSEEDHLINDLGFSSVDLLYMVIAIEETFDIRFENVQLSDVDTLGKVVTYIQEHVAS